MKLPLLIFSSLMVVSIYGQDTDPYGQAIEETPNPNIVVEFDPPVNIEQAVISARRVFSKYNYNPNKFEVSSAHWKETLFNPDPEQRNPFDEMQALKKEFGNGPAWVVRFKRKKSFQSLSGNWWDDWRGGIVVLVFEGNRAALIDRRFGSDPDDKLENK